MVASRIPTLYLRTLLELAQERGCDPLPWLQANGLTPSDLTRPDIVISTARNIELVRLAIEHSKEPSLGLMLGQRLRMNTHGKLSFALMNSANLRQAIALTGRFLPVRTNLLTMRFDDHPETPRLVFSPAVELKNAERLVVEAVMLAVRNVFEYLAPGAQSVQAVSFATASTPYDALTQTLFGCPVSYDAPSSAMHINPSALSLRLNTADAQALEQAAVMCQAELDKLAKPESLTASLQHRLLNASDDMPSLEACAQALHMTPRTLNRRLQDENTSYRAIVDQVRHHLALQHLKNSQLSLQEIAYRLGYTDQANFRRAFKRWEGVAPQKRRDAAADKGPASGPANPGQPDDPGG